MNLIRKIKFEYSVILIFLISIGRAIPQKASMSGEVVNLERNKWNIIIQDDNNDTTISTTFRSWWYAKISDIDTSKVSTVLINGEGFTGARFATPVYSYDNENWIPFQHNEITNMTKSSCNKRLCYNYQINKKFAKREVFIARHYPYRISDLYKFLRQYQRDKWLRIDTIGYSPSQLPIIELTITNTSIPDKNKNRILIHSRTHPSETMSSFVIEGMLEMLLNPKNQYILDELIFNIIPILNVDGVEYGLSRNNLKGQNLEESWFRHELDAYLLDEKCPEEVHILHKFFTKHLEREPKVIAAINIHSFNPQYYQKPYAFIFSNFFDWSRYQEKGKSLWIKQAKFLKFFNEEYCTPVLGRTNPKTTSTIDKKDFPESWWWVNFKDEVMAVTLESSPEQICINGTQRSDQANKFLGQALAKALYKYSLFIKSFNLDSPSAIENASDLFQYWERVESESYLR